jgi:hypothetical protein
MMEYMKIVQQDARAARRSAEDSAARELSGAAERALQDNRATGASEARDRMQKAMDAASESGGPLSPALSDASSGLGGELAGILQDADE